MRYIVPPASLYPDRYAFLLSHLAARPVDRGGSLQLAPDLVVLKGVPRFDPGFSMGFGEICRHVAGKIHAASRLPVTVLWSGGIDSTCVLCSFLLIGAKVDVALSEESIRENPQFYRHVIAGNPSIGRELRFDNIVDYLHRHEARAVHVSGELADQIYFITYPGYGLGNDELFNAPPGCGIPAPYMEVYRPLIDACPVPLANNYDFLWWENFTLKYQSVQARIHIHAGRRLRNLIHFFEDTLFEHWAMANDHSVKCPGADIRNHKYPAKELIHEVFPHDSVFLMWKQKSLIKALPKPSNAGGNGRTSRAHWHIDEHWNVFGATNATAH